MNEASNKTWELEWLARSVTEYLNRSPEDTHSNLLFLRTRIYERHGEQQPIQFEGITANMNVANYRT